MLRSTWSNGSRRLQAFNVMPRAGLEPAVTAGWRESAGSRLLFVGYKQMNK
ncbi:MULTISPECIES: hypothetical protein [Paenibacillus]|uniref:hypothetical protein n=1 Tax=Paenibacillus TaxID=44249 RepID=UPI0004B7E47F|nr:hypothetical protein [Paenibacillus sp. IHBB 10380]